MAKGKNRINIEFSDGDTLKDLQKKLKKAAGGFDSLATSQRGADRAAKGLTQQSSNQTKNFSKIQQGISGGLVPIYATLAAQVFAVTAAFQFLSNAIDYKNLIAGQQSFGAVTGVALTTYTKGVQAATEGQLRFAEAAQSVAIGTAAGLSRAQITEIGKAAKNTSLALGRDLTDSFNRLTRGITKAEPELLDELGIILRLDPALKAYADSIGKSKEQLNQFEKSQAVANEVLGQAESKFGKISEIMDPSAFALQQFAVAFDDLVNKFKLGIGKFLLPLLQFLSKNVYALTAALSLFALPIVKTILPNFDEMGKSAAKNMKIASKAVRSAQKDLDMLKGDNKKLRQDSFSGINQLRAGKSLGPQRGMFSQMTQKQIDADRLALQKGGALRDQFNKKERAQYKMHLKKQEMALRISEAKKRGEYAKTAGFFKVKQAQMVLIQKQAASAMVAVTRVAATAMTKLLSFAGYIGLFVMLGSMVMSFVESRKKENEEQTKLNEKLKEQLDIQKQLNEELGRMNEVRAKGLVAQGLDTAVQFGNMVQSADITKSIEKTQGFISQQALINRKEGKAAPQLLSGEEMNKKGLKQARKELADLENQIKFKEKVLRGESSFGKVTSQSQVDTLNKQIAKRKEAIEVVKEEIAALEMNGFSNEDLNNSYQNNIKTLKELEKGAVGPLKNMYKQVREELEKNGNVSQETLDNLAKEERAYGNLTTRIKRYGEVSKSFQQALTGMAGKGLPLQAQRRAVNDMITSTQAVIQGTELGGITEDMTGPLSEDQSKKLATLKQDKEKLKQLEKFKTILGTIVQEEKNLLTTRQTNARTMLEHATARTVAEKKAKLTATGMLAVNEKLARAKQDQRNAEAAEEALQLKGYKTRASFVEEFGEKAQEEIEKYIEGGGILEENVKDAEYAVKVAKDKVTTVEKEVEVQEKLNGLSQIQLDIQENNLKLKRAQLEQDTLALQKQLENVGFNTMYGNTGFGQRAKKQQDIELKSFEIEKQRLAIETQRANLAKQNYDTNSVEYQAEMASINNNEKKLELLEKQTEASRYAASALGEIQMSFAKGIEDMFVAIATGSKSAKEAFKDLALFMLKKMAEMAAQQLAMKAIMAMGLPIPMAKGGIIPMASGGVIRKYGSGGIATEPTYLVGEGKHNEAVVPLPDGRSIPVDMKGGAGDNNVQINVNVDGSSTNSFDGERGKALGKMIEASTMEIIMREKRPGGVLGR